MRPAFRLIVFLQSLPLITLLTALPLHATTEDLHLTLAPSESVISFELAAQHFRGHGKFTEFSGHAVYDTNRRVPSSIKFTIDLSKIRIDSKDPRAQLVVNQLLATLPDPVLTFRSTDIRPSGTKLLTVEGVASSAGREENVSVVLQSAGTARSIRLDGRHATDALVDGPLLLLVGPHKASVRGALVFKGTS
jgi:polyisoprenoid-binding protein YceI